MSNFGDEMVRGTQTTARCFRLIHAMQPTGWDEAFLQGTETHGKNVK